MKVDLKLTGVDNVIDLLHSLPKEVVAKNGGPVRASLRKGAKVIFKQAKSNLQAAIANTTDPEQRASTGLLEKNLVVSRGKPPTTGNGERYLVRVRRKKYPRKGKTTTTLKSAQLLEYGSSQQPAEPWLRPAFISRARQAIDVVTTDLVKSLNKIVRKLSKGK